MCFTLGGGGSRGDVTQNSYYNKRPWEPTDVKPMSLGPGEYTRAGADKINTEDQKAVDQVPTPKRSSLTTGGSA
mgnify:FL=1|tara:strand:- start:358 stop:579 length:222 start_codon:yes stop_codon:yes gene_type:complete